MTDTNSATTAANAANPAQTATADQDRIAALEAENAKLREQLVAAGQTAEVQPTSPSFRFSAGEADELERFGRTMSPFDGKLYVGTGTKDAREATPAEYHAAKPPKEHTNADAKADARKSTAAAGRSRRGSGK